jgi:hypothetical protein
MKLTSLFYTNIIVEPRITAPQTKPCFIAVECPDAIASGINSRNDTLTSKKKKTILFLKQNKPMSKGCLKKVGEPGEQKI